MRHRRQLSAKGQGNFLALAGPRLHFNIFKGLRDFGARGRLEDAAIRDSSTHPHAGDCTVPFLPATAAGP